MGINFLKGMLGTKHNDQKYSVVTWYNMESFDNIQSVQRGKVTVLVGHSIGHLSKNIYMNMCPIPNDFRDRAI